MFHNSDHKTYFFKWLKFFELQKQLFIPFIKVDQGEIKSLHFIVKTNKFNSILF